MIQIIETEICVLSNNIAQRNFEILKLQSELKYLLWLNEADEEVIYSRKKQLSKLR